jgi:hypothetical protein
MVHTIEANKDDVGTKHLQEEENAQAVMVEEELETKAATTTTGRRSKTKGRNPDRKRHGARNQNRHKNFVKWIIDRFDLESSYIPRQGIDSQEEELHTTTSKNNDENATLKSTSSSPTTERAASTTGRQRRPRQHILDVAGGRGEVSARLTMCHRQKVVMVDPRPANVVDCFEKVVLPKLPNKWQQQLEKQRRNDPTFLQNIIPSRFQQLVTTFDDNNLTKCEELQTAISDSSLILGLHADSATEAIVDAALRYSKPFVVVPCCVFPNLFQSRMVPDETKHDQLVPVRSHEQFCIYLQRKDPRFVMEELPFEGRNIAIWWDGK